MGAARLQKLALGNFTLFDECELPFTPGINVILGENATGKTHLLKLLYAVCRSVATAKDLDCSKTGFTTHLSKRLVRNFQVDAVGRLASRVQGHKHSTVTVTAEGSISFDFSTRDREVNLRRWEIGKQLWPDPVYLPTKEVLSMFHGLVPAMAESHLELEELYSDLALKLGARAGAGKRADWQQKLIMPLEKMLKASIDYDENAQRFYIKQRGLGRVEAGLAAEGYRKIGMLLQLVANRSLADNAVLFWDEPEANMNPAFAEPLAELLAAFARQGTQVFLATHDYFTLKYLALTAAAQQAPVRYFGLYREVPTDKFVRFSIENHLYDLEPNPVIDAFERLYQRESKQFYSGRLRRESRPS